MVKMLKALESDAEKLLEIQQKAFIVYSQKYGDFDSNPYHMDLHRMQFNIKYRYGQYYKLLDSNDDKIIGGLFCFELDQKEILKIAQFYLLEPYQHLGYGTYVLNKLFELNPQLILAVLTS